MGRENWAAPRNFFAEKNDPITTGPAHFFAGPASAGRGSGVNVRRENWFGSAPFFFAGRVFGSAPFFFAGRVIDRRSPVV